MSNTYTTISCYYWASYKSSRALKVTSQMVFSYMNKVSRNIPESQRWKRKHTGEAKSALLLICKILSIFSYSVGVVDHPANNNKKKTCKKFCALLQIANEMIELWYRLELLMVIHNKAADLVSPFYPGRV